jgi:hypothetical protein
MSSDESVCREETRDANPQTFGVDRTDAADECGTVDEREIKNQFESLGCQQ